MTKIRAFRKRDILEMCLSEGHLAGQEEGFRQVYSILISLSHYQFHQTLEDLKDSYATIDPDTDVRLYEKIEHNNNFKDLLTEVLEKANYELVSKGSLLQSFNESSLFPIKLRVNLYDFSEILIFSRGETTKEETVRSWFGLRNRRVIFSNFYRVVIFLRFRETYLARDNIVGLCSPGATMLKLFQNVPKADLEMLFPNTEVCMRLIDKFLIGIPAVLRGGIVISTKVGATIILLVSMIGYWLGVHQQPVELNKTTLLAVLAGLGALGGYLWRQFRRFKNRKLSFMQALTLNLYLQNLDNKALPLIGCVEII